MNQSLVDGLIDSISVYLGNTLLKTYNDIKTHQRCVNLNFLTKSLPTTEIQIEQSRQLCVFGCNMYCGRFFDSIFQGHLGYCLLKKLQKHDVAIVRC